MPVLDVAAERAVLSCLVRYGRDFYTDVADALNEHAFTLDSNQVIYQCARYTFEECDSGTLDMAAIYAAANSLGLGRFFDKQEEKDYLRSLSVFPVQQETGRKLAAKIAKLEVARRLADELDCIKKRVNEISGDEPIEKILSLAENPILDLSNSVYNTSNNKPVRIGEGIEGYLQFLADNPRTTVGIPGPYPKYNKAIGGGFRKGAVNIIGARMKQGKTVLADNFSLHIAGQLGIPVLNIDTEMSKEDHWNRMAANLSMVPIDAIENGDYAKDNVSKGKVQRAGQFLANIPYDWISVAGMPIESIMSMVRRWILQKVGLDENGHARPCLIIYDYLKLMSADGISNDMKEYQLIGFYLTSFVNLMIKYQAAGLAFIQLNRDGIDKESTDVVSQSDRILWFCDSFSIFKPKGEEENIGADAKYNRKLVTLLSRHGGGMDDGDYINMEFIRPCAKIIEGPSRTELVRSTMQTTQGFEVEGNLEDNAKF